MTGTTEASAALRNSPTPPILTGCCGTGGPGRTAREVAKFSSRDAERLVAYEDRLETVAEVLDRGFWAAFSIYPHSKMTSPRMCEIVRQYGGERLIVEGLTAGSVKS